MPLRNAGLLHHRSIAAATAASEPLRQLTRYPPLYCSAPADGSLSPSELSLQVKTPSGIASLPAHPWTVRLADCAVTDWLIIIRPGQIVRPLGHHILHPVSTYHISAERNKCAWLLLDLHCLLTRVCLPLGSSPLYLHLKSARSQD